MPADDRGVHPELDRIRRLASELAGADSGPAGELAGALADAVLDIADRVDGLWRLIAAVIAAADRPGPVEPGPVEPGPVEPGPVEPGAIGSGAIGSGAAGSGAAGSGAIGSGAIGSGAIGSGAIGSGAAGSGAAGPGARPLGAAGPPPAEFLRALTAGRGSGHQGVRLSIGGRDWVAAISHEQRSADPAGAWSALERLARSAEPGWPDPPE
jgi:hypothetical protein